MKEATLKAFDYQPVFKKSDLDCGVRVVTEHHPNTRSTSAAIYVELGTRDEPEEIIGAAHFVEHMVFKGTQTRSAYEIVKVLEAVGGELNAYTSKEYTCFHACTLREHLNLSLDVLVDLVSHASFNEEDLDKERSVIKQEIDMSSEQFEEYIFDLYFEKAYQGHNLSRPILGTYKTLDGISRDKLFDFYKSRYHGPNMIVSVAGDVDHNSVVDYVDQNYGKKQLPFEKPERTTPQMGTFKSVAHRPSEQIHVIMGLPSSTYIDNLRFEAFIVNALLGSGMTSRLYQKVREDLGLAYSIYSYLHTFVDTGTLMTYVGTAEKHVPKVMELIKKEMVDLKLSGITQEELDLFKTQVIGTIILGADDVENRMNSIAVNEMIFGKYRPVDEIIAEIQRVSQESIMQYLETYFNFPNMGTIVLGDVKKEKAMQWIENVSE